MKLRPVVVFLLTFALGAGAVFLTWRYAHPGRRPAPAAHDQDHPHAPEPPQGPHGGRLLRADDFAVELVLFERGVPPEFRAHVSAGGRPVPPSEVELSVSLARLGGRQEIIRFAAEGDYLRGDRPVREPHSFVVTVTARHHGREHAWRYDAFEGRVELPAAAAARAGITTALAGPATLRETLTVPGRVALNLDTLARVTPRYAGLVRSASKQLGERAAAGEVLAVIEANDSLQSYEVRAPRAGTVIARNVAAGEFAPAGEALYTLADLSTVWIELLVPRADAARVRAGQRVTLHAPGGPETTATITTLTPLGEMESQSVTARVELPDADGAWRPGWFAQGTIQLGEHTARVAVPAAALQTWDDRTFVFLNENDIYEALPVTTGRRDGDLVEIVEGLEPAMRYVTGNSFLLKAELLKSGASHDH